MNLTPIDTPYKGHLFRSRLEARWAVFFDQLGLKWEYEPEGFVLSDGTRYLPDFRVKTPQGCDMWIEVKRAGVASDPKFDKFVKALQDDADARHWAEFTRAELVSGSPAELLQAGKCFCPRCGVPLGQQFEWSGGMGWYTHCDWCDPETPSGGGHETEATGVGGASWSPHKGDIHMLDGDARRWHQVLLAAATAAQSARFEHGEAGVVKAKSAARKQKRQGGKQRAARVTTKPLPGMDVTHSSFGTGLVTHVFGSPLSRAGMAVAVKFPGLGPRVLSYPLGSSLGRPIHAGRHVYSVQP